MKPRILFVVPAEFDALRRKGVDRMIRERDEDGFFERVITVHPLADEERVIDLDPAHRIHEFPLRRLISADRLGGMLAFPFAAARVARAVARIARDERVSLVRATDPYLMGLIAWWVSRSLGIPFCISLHADYQKSFALTPKRGYAAWRRRLADLLPRFVVPRAAMLMPISEYLSGVLEQAGGSRSAIRVIPHGIDMTPFTASPVIDVRATFTIPSDAFVVSFVGRLSGDVYASEMAEVCARLLSRRRGVVCVIAGNGPEEARVRSRLHGDPCIAAGVRMLPFQPYDRVVALRRASQASLCLIGGFSLIEACAAGSVAIAYDVEWHGELLQDGVTGFLIREHDIDAAVSAIEELIDNPARAAAMGREAQRVACERHDLRSTSRIKRGCYAEVLALATPS